MLDSRGTLVPGTHRKPIHVLLAALAVAFIATAIAAIATKDPGISDLVSLFLAVFAATLSATNWYQDQQKKSHQLRFRCSLELGREKGAGSIVVGVTNVGSRVAVVEGLALITTAGSGAGAAYKLAVRPDNRLTEGATLGATGSCNELAQELRAAKRTGQVELCTVAFLSDGTQLHSDTFSFDVDSWSDPAPKRSAGARLAALNSDTSWMA